MNNFDLISELEKSSQKQIIVRFAGQLEPGLCYLNWFWFPKKNEYLLKIVFECSQIKYCIFEKTFERKKNCSKCLFFCVFYDYIQHIFC